MLALMIGITVGLFAAGLVFALHDGAEARRRAVRTRVARVLGETEGAVSDELPLALRETQSDLSNVLSGAAQKLGFLRSLDLMLYRAGRPVSLGRLLGLTLGLTVGGAVLGSAAIGNPLPALLGLGPILLVWRKKQKRMALFDLQFPQALQLFARALRAGHGLTSGMQMVGDSIGDPVGSEFALVAREISLGLDTGTAIANLQDRIGSPDLAVFTTAVLVQLETGGNLAEILDNMGDMIRERILFKGKVKALTAQSRMSANVLVGVPIGIACTMYVFDPSYVEVFWTTEAGKLMGGASLTFLTLGYLLCRKLAQVEA